MNTQKQIFLIVALFFLFVGACGAYAAVDLPVRARDQKGWHESESIERGALLFANNCRTCHGNHGEGGIGLALNIDQYKDQDPLVLKNNRDKLERTLYCGRAGTRMQPWLDTNGGALNERQVEHLINFITAPGTVESEELAELTGGGGTMSNKGWEEAVEFAHNLNHESAVIVGGDTFDSIAKDHRIGILLLVAANNGMDPDAHLERGSDINLPPSRDFPNGRKYRIRTDNDTLSKIAEGQHVGSIALAELNNYDYRYDLDNNILTLRQDGQDIAGLFPGDTIALPDGAQYIVKAGDTPASIAEQHGISESAITGGDNAGIVQLDDEGQIVAERRLQLPSNASTIAREGDTISALALAFGTTDDALIGANSGLTPESTLTAGQELALPADAYYVVQRGDTVESVAARLAGVSVDDLVRLNEIDPAKHFGPEVVLQLPKVDAYTVVGQSLDDLAGTFSNVTGSSLASANSLPDASAIVRIGQTLRLPDDAWGSAASDAINPGTACLEWIIPESVFKENIPGLGTPAPEAEKPEQVTNELVIKANANDWTFVADGTTMPANQGVVLIAVGSEVNFTDTVGLHTITLNGEKEGADISNGDSRTLTFDTAGKFQLTCDYHVAMQGTIFVE